MTTTIQLSLVLPCYNEAEHIERSLPRIIRTLDNTRTSYEIILVDDCSKDQTRSLIEDIVNKYPDHRLRYLFHEKNTGRGGAVMDGIRLSEGEVIGFIDIDLEVGSHYIPLFVESIMDGADVSIAHRIYRIQPHNLIRHILSRGYLLLVQMMLKLPYNDTEAGYKFFSKEAALKLIEKTNDQGWFWDTEVLLRAHELNMKVAEITCLFERNPGKTSTVRPIADSLAYWRSLQQYRKTIKHD